jgi:GntR family transcriptional regulator
MSASPLALHIDLTSGGAAYEQIAAELRALLVADQLTPGDLLPPVRRLAMDLGVHFNTVAQSYRILADEGWLDLRRGRGALVVARGRVTSSVRVDDDFSLRLHRLLASALAQGVSPRAIRRALDDGLHRFLKPHSL